MPRSFDQDSASLPCRVRQRIWSRPAGVGQDARLDGGDLDPVVERADRSARSGRGRASARGRPASRASRPRRWRGRAGHPSGRAMGLFLIGPRMPSGSLRGFDQVRPSSSEVCSTPHHFDGARADLGEQEDRPVLRAGTGPGSSRGTAGRRPGRRRRPGPASTTCPPRGGPRRWTTSGSPSAVPPNQAARKPVRGLDDRRGVAGRGRRRLEDEPGLDDRGRLGPRGRGGQGRPGGGQEDRGRGHGRGPRGRPGRARHHRRAVAAREGRGVARDAPSCPFSATLRVRGVTRAGPDAKLSVHSRASASGRRGGVGIDRRAARVEGAR